MVRIDGKTYRWLSPGLPELPTVTQKSSKVRPNSTTIECSAAGVDLKMIFSDPMDIFQPETLANPVSTLTMEARSNDGKDHTVSWYFDASAELVVDRDSQEVGWTRLRIAGKDAVLMGCSNSAPLGKVGDDLRIDWGRAILTSKLSGDVAAGSSEAFRREFSNSGKIGDTDDLRQPRPASDNWPAMVWVSEIQQVSGKSNSRAELLLAYDDDPAIEYFKRQLSPIWKSRGREISDVLIEAAKDEARADESTMYQDWSKKFGEGYANLATLAYRQSLAGHKLVEDIDGTLLMFPKENFSNGCISTVDVIYPACPNLLGI